MSNKIFLILLLGLIFLSIPAVKIQANINNSYQELRDYAYNLLTSSNLDKEVWEKLINEQGCEYGLLEQGKDIFHGFLFNNPKGSEVLYNDFAMAMAIGYDRLGRPNSLKKSLRCIIDRRLRMWHGLKNNNFYAREYASLATLAFLTDDKLFPSLQNKVQQSVNKIYLSDGYAYEGPEYGLYSMSILSGYVYFTHDDIVKQKIIDNINWLSSISSTDRYKPPFDDSLARLLPKKISAFAEVNDYWQNDFKFSNIPTGNTYNNQETIWRYDNNATIWLRHRQKNAEWQGLHRNYSNGDILLKQNNVWWLVAPGYRGWENKNAKPELHNVAMSNLFYSWRWAWRFLLGQGAKLISYKEGDIDQAIVQLDGNILRTVESDENSLTVSDQSKKGFKQFWQVNGQLIDERQDKNKITLRWQQGDKILNQIISGANSFSMHSASHTGKNTTDIIAHMTLMVEGKNITAKFTW